MATRPLIALLPEAQESALDRTLEVPLDVLERRRPIGLAAENVGTPLRSLEMSHVLRALEDAHWVIAGPKGAAARLGMKRTTLQSLIKRLRIAKPA